MNNDVFSPFPLLSTSRLTLRQVSNNDEKEIFLLRSNEQVNKFIDREKAHSIEDCRRFIDLVNNNIKINKSLYWAITSGKQDKLIGTICIFNISKENNKAEIGFELLPENQRKGIMQEALQKVIEFGFEKMKLQSIEAVTHFQNERSLDLLRKFNFKKDENPAVTGHFIILKLTKPK